MSRALIIGYGNPLRGDDGLGPYAARLLRDLLSEPDVEVLEAHQLMPEMAELVSQSETTLFIDADRSAPAGRISVSRLEPAPESPSFTHHVSPSSLLTMAELLYGRRPEAYLLSAGVATFEFEDRLSPEAAAALEKIVGRACDLVGPRR